MIAAFGEGLVAWEADPRGNRGFGRRARAWFGQKKTGDLGDVGRRRSLERVERGVRESFGVAYTEKLEGLWLTNG